MLTPLHKLSEAQLEVLKTLRDVNDEKELQEVKQLLNFFFRKKLAAAINKAEAERGFTTRTYFEWLASKTKATQEDADRLADETNAAWLASRRKHDSRIVVNTKKSPASCLGTPL